MANQMMANRFPFLIVKGEESIKAVENSSFKEILEMSYQYDFNMEMVYFEDLFKEGKEPQDLLYDALVKYDELIYGWDENEWIMTSHPRFQELFEILISERT